MAGGKHAQDEGFDFESIPWKPILLSIVIIAIIIGVVFGGKTVYSSFLANGDFFKFGKEKNETQENIVIEESMPTNLYGYKVLGELNIENKNYSSYILDSGIDYSKKTTENNEAASDLAEENTEAVEEKSVLENNSEKITDALKKGLVKLYGERLNQKGNFVIMGHNEENKFAILNDLKVGDNLSVKTVSKLEKKYVVTEITTVEPTDLKALMPNKEYTILTLITCKTGSDERLVVKAIEENDYKKMNATKTVEENANVENEAATTDGVDSME